MFLIASGAYLSPEFSSQFGRIPPSFLPLENKRLFEFQIDAARKVSDDIVLSLPDDFTLSKADDRRLAALGVRIVRVPNGMSLGASITYCLNVCMVPDAPIQILHGDTLFIEGLTPDADRVWVSTAEDFYSWGQVQLQTDGCVATAHTELRGQQSNVVLSGYFTFSQPRKLIASISKVDFDFVRGIADYATDQALTAEPVEGWMDFGHLTSYYKSRARYTTERVFNSLSMSQNVLTKSSGDVDKMRAEAAWMENLPTHLQCFAPKLLGKTLPGPADGPAVRASYALEYLYLSTLSELYTFGDLPPGAWRLILSRCAGFLSRARETPPPATDLGALTARFSQQKYRDKLEQRLSQACREMEIDATLPMTLNGAGVPSLNAIAAEVAGAIPDAAAADIGVWHGDFCFSNIFYDFRSQQPKVIDPRGRDFDGIETIYGDCRYDVAKLLHSVIGRYDAIIARRYDLTWNGAQAFDLEVFVTEDQAAVERYVIDIGFGSYDDAPWRLPMTISLFLSMLPLHFDDRQRQIALLANALRLYVLWKDTER